MELKEILAQLEKNNAFKEWRAGHAQAFLAHAFVILDEANKDAWQVGYFDEASSTMTTFVLKSDAVQLIPDQEVMKAEQRILPLKPEEVTLPTADALGIAQRDKVAHYPRETPAKTFFIIQNLAAHGTVYNITFFTTSFKTINLKLDAKTGKVVHRSIQELAAFG
jgi:hypothetical protein